MTAIPNYQQFMEPCLRVLSGGRLIPKKELIDLVSDEVGLSEEDRQAVSDSGRNVARIRITWALAYLKQARAIDNPERGKYMVMEPEVFIGQTSGEPVINNIVDELQMVVNAGLGIKYNLTKNYDLYIGHLYISS